MRAVCVRVGCVLCVRAGYVCIVGRACAVCACCVCVLRVRECVV